MILHLPRVTDISFSHISWEKKLCEMNFLPVENEKKMTSINLNLQTGEPEKFSWSRYHINILLLFMALYRILTPPNIFLQFLSSPSYPFITITPITLVPLTALFPLLLNRGPTFSFCTGPSKLCSQPWSGQRMINIHHKPLLKTVCAMNA